MSYDPDSISHSEARKLKGAQRAEWKRLKMKKLLKPYKGAERIARRSWARAVVRKILKD